MKLELATSQFKVQGSKVEASSPDITVFVVHQNFIYIYYEIFHQVNRCLSRLYFYSGSSKSELRTERNDNIG